MLGYIIRRLLYMIPILLGVAFLVFTLFTTVGEDPVRIALGNHASPEAIADLRAKWGLDQPLHLQFLDFLKQIITFDYGRSFNTGEKLSELFAQGAVCRPTVAEADRHTEFRLPTDCYRSWPTYRKFRILFKTKILSSVSAILPTFRN